MVQDMLGSKKFIAAVLSSVIALVAVLFGVEVKEALLIISPLITYIGAQGLADLGKEAKKIDQ